MSPPARLTELARRGQMLADEMDRVAEPGARDSLIYYPAKITVWAAEVRAALRPYPDHLATFDAPLDAPPVRLTPDEMGDVMLQLRQYRERLGALMDGWQD